MSDLILIGALLITIFLRVQICRLAAFIILLPFKNFLSPSFKVPMLRFLLLALPLIITGITLFSYNSSSSASIFSHTDTISMEKEEPLSNTITDNGITEDSLLKSAQASSSTHTNSAEKNSADNDSAQKYSADETSDKLSAHTLAARNVSPVFTVDISNTSAASIISIWISVSIILLTIVLVNRIRTNLLLNRTYINKKKEWKKAIS
ncbi:MAG TPA: hypothetical protein PLR39_11665, partial [Treponemataceae bacterium]|nr:hypothetical protein [Treponemataceae bacterium]